MLEIPALVLRQDDVKVPNLDCTHRTEATAFLHNKLWSVISAKTARTVLIMLFLKRAANGGRFSRRGRSIEGAFLKRAVD